MLVGDELRKQQPRDLCASDIWLHMFRYERPMSTFFERAAHLNIDTNNRTARSRFSLIMQVVPRLDSSK